MEKSSSEATVARSEQRSCEGYSYEDVNGDVEVGGEAAESADGSGDAVFVSDSDEEEVVKHDDEARRRRIRTRDKIAYVVGLANLVATCFFCFAEQWVMPYYYTAKFPLLVGTRVFLYVGTKSQYFLLDFCYYANLAFLFYIWAAPEEARLFVAVFCLANGPLAVAVALFNNALVFHELGRTTSLFIHITPVLTSYCLRWFPGRRGVGGGFDGVKAIHTTYEVCLNESCTVSPVWGILAPLAFFCVHQLVYMVLVHCLPNKTLKADRTFGTTYRHITRNKDGYLWKWVNLFGRQGRVYMYGIVQIVFCTACISMGYLCYHVFAVHLAWILICAMKCVYNGGSYYIEYMPRRYEGIDHTADAFQQRAKSKAVPLNKQDTKT